jgi:CHRD domain
MRLSKPVTSLALAAIIASTAVVAKDIPIVLTGAEETPPVTTAAKGTGTFTIADDHSVSGFLKTSGIEGTIAHIHVGAPGVSGPPIITLEKDGTGWRVPQGAKLTDEQFASYTAGNLYVNVHSQDHKPGEIRAQLKP